MHHPAERDLWAAHQKCPRVLAPKPMLCCFAVWQDFLGLAAQVYSSLKNSETPECLMHALEEPLRRGLRIHSKVQVN